MRPEELKENINRVAAPLAADLGIDIVEINVGTPNRMIAVQVLTDRPAGGISMDECSLLNRKLDQQIQELFLPDGNYTLEVSSPGLDRNLTTYRDFGRVIGRNVHVFLRERVRGKMELTGKVKAVTERELIVQVKKEDWLIPLEHLDKAKQIII